MATRFHIKEPLFSPVLGIKPLINSNSLHRLFTLNKDSQLLQILIKEPKEKKNMKLLSAGLLLATAVVGTPVGDSKEYEYIVIGSGPGGGPLA